MARLIPLTQGEYALVDDGVYDYFIKFKWHYSQGYACRFFEGKVTPMHYWILHPRGGKIVDHINGITLDNRRCNLRLATVAENTKNRKKHKNNKTGYKGVCWDIVNKKYHVTLRFEGKKVFLGRFENIIEAAMAYDNGAKKYFGEFARLNFPKNV